MTKQAIIKKMKHLKIFQLSKLILAAGLLILAQTLAKAEDRNFGDFNSIRVGGVANVILVQSESCSVNVEGNSSDTSKIKISMEGGVLVITSKGNLKNSEKLKVKVKIKELKNLELSGACDVKTEDELLVDYLKIQSSGAGNGHLQVKAIKISSEVSGAGDLHLSGTANLLKAKISGAGELKAYNLVCDSVKVDVSGSGTAKVNAEKSIIVQVSGAGNVIYKGEPIDRNVDISGAGSVRQAKGENEVEINESLKISHSDGDTTRLKLGDQRILIYGDKSEEDTVKKQNQVKSIWTGFEVGVNGYLTPGGSSDFPKKYNFLELNYKKSICINFNFWEKNFKLYKNYIALTTGAGFEFNRYFFDNNTTLQPLNDTVSGYVSGIDFRKNCLKASYVTVPLLLEFNTNAKEKKSFHLAAGLVGGYNLSTKVKQVYELNNKTYKNKVKDDYNMNPFKLAATVRAGYGRFNVFATYGLTPLFQKKASAPELTAFTVGVTLVHFD
jgi:hypothetical protein